jgi:hypothetical protein
VWQPEEGSFMKNPRNKDKQHFSPTDAAAEGSNTGTTRNAMNREKVAADKPTRDIVRANQPPREARTFEQHHPHLHSAVARAKGGRASEFTFGSRGDPHERIHHG